MSSNATYELNCQHCEFAVTKTRKSQADHAKDRHETIHDHTVTKRTHLSA